MHELFASLFIIRMRIQKITTRIETPSFVRTIVRVEETLIRKHNQVSVPGQDVIVQTRHFLFEILLTLEPEIS